MYFETRERKKNIRQNQISNVSNIKKKKKPKKEKKLTWKNPVSSTEQLQSCLLTNQKKKKKRRNKLTSFLSWLKLSIWRLLTYCFSPCLWDETRAYSKPWQANCCLNYNLTFDLLVKMTFPWHGFVKLSFPFCKPQDRTRCASKLFQESCRE